MQVFLPSPDFTESVRALDNKRLGNQCYRECLTLYKGGWPNHPAALMWAPYKTAMSLYGWEAAIEMGRRDYWGVGVAEKWQNWWSMQFELNMEMYGLVVPIWIGDSKIHHSHQANLVRKNPERYSKLYPGVEEMNGYYWPWINEDGTEYVLRFRESG